MGGRFLRGGKQSRYHFVRSGSRSIRAKGDTLRRLQELASRIPFDDRIHTAATLKDLDLGLIRSFLNEIKSELFEESGAMPFSELCRLMNIARGPDEALRPINAGLLFFSREPDRFFPRSWIEVVLRKDEAGKDFTERYFKGPLHIQLRDALSFIKGSIIEEHVRKISDRAEAERFFNFPYIAVEEALANAVYHKSYESGAPIEIQIWNDKIEILSFPGPLPPVTATILAKNQRVVARDYRNRRVGDFLKELHLTEGRGTGIPTINRAMKNNGSPDPVLETDEHCSYFLTVFPIHEQASVEDSVEDSVEVAIVRYCQRARSKNEILDYLGLSIHTNNFNRNVLPAIEKKWIAMTLPDKPTSKNQRYLITEQGRQLLAGTLQ
ncbi:MAG: ATP-binding protein [Chlorobium sp.]